MQNDSTASYRHLQQLWAYLLHLDDRGDLQRVGLGMRGGQWRRGRLPRRRRGYGLCQPCVSISTVYPNCEPRGQYCSNRSRAPERRYSMLAAISADTVCLPVYSPSPSMLFFGMLDAVHHGTRTVFVSLAPLPWKRVAICHEERRRGTLMPN